ncbi:MAG TPA: hypothetical protein VMG82_32670 [Candidatus Sulfotelmatobacter sp.]|nr:hypothetical protein [Candidatus Sulfotelmatobacter sp.]
MEDPAPGATWITGALTEGGALGALVCGRFTLGATLGAALGAGLGGALGAGAGAGGGAGAGAALGAGLGGGLLGALDVCCAKTMEENSRTVARLRLESRISTSGQPTYAFIRGWGCPDFCWTLLRP